MNNCQSIASEGQSVNMKHANPEETALGAAMIRANIARPRFFVYADVMDIAVEAWERWPDKFNSSRPIRHGYVRDRLRGDLTYALICNIPQGRQLLFSCINDLLTEAFVVWMKKPKSAQPMTRDAVSKTAGGGLDRNDTQERLAPATSSPDGQSRAAVPGSGSGHPGVDIQRATARPTTSPNTDTGPVPVGGGQDNPDTHGVGAPATSSPDDVQPNTGRRSEPATLDATPKEIAPAAPFSYALKRPTAAELKGPSLSVLAAKQRERMSESVKVAVKLSRLDLFTVTINTSRGQVTKPIGQCSVSEVHLWIEEQNALMREGLIGVRFARALISNLPSNAVVGEVWKDQRSVEDLFSRAEREGRLAAKATGCAA
jgi:hypothetical protein